MNIFEKNWKRLKKNLTKEPKKLAQKCYSDFMKLLTFEKLFPFKKQPVLLLSYPRSGSSWSGDMLSLSPDVSYLYEPVNLPYAILFRELNKLNELSLEETNDRVLKVDHFKEGSELFNELSALSDSAFKGCLPKVRYKNFFWKKFNYKPFLLPRRLKNTLLIKEVLPNGAGFFVERYSPKVIFLQRHPAAIVDSLLRLNWMKYPLDEFGFLYGTVVSKALEAVKNTESVTVYYEDLASSPYAEFSKLFDFMEVSLPNDFERKVEEFCNGHQGDMDNPFETKRVSSNQIYKWKENLSKEQIDQIMEGYHRSGMSDY